MSNQTNRPWVDQPVGIAIFLIMGLSVFFFNESVRSIFVTSSIVSYFNPLFIGTAGIAVLIHLLAGRISPGVVIIALAFWCITLLTNLNSGENLFKYAVTTTNLLLPLLITGITLNGKLSDELLTKFVKVLNAIVFLMICIGIPDLISGGKIQFFMIQHVFDPDLARLAALDHNSGIYRLYFIFGHTLTIAWYMLLFFVVNVVHNRTIGVLLPSYVISAVTFVGLVLCNSRTALIIGILMIIFLNRPSKRAVAYYLAVFFLLGGILMLPVVQENIKQRFVSGIESGSVSGGRNEAVMKVFEGVVEPPGLILGTGIGSSRKITEQMGQFVESFEYPVLMFGYDFSILGTFLLYLVVLILPTLHFVICRQWLIVGLFLSITLYINGFNILSGYTDYLGQFCFVIMLLKNVAAHHAAGNAAADAPVISKVAMPV